ncbi:uncharacterized protein PV07_12855, partial [Cladophialophora immunda]
MTASIMDQSRQWQKQFRCPSCSKSFVRKAHMLRHQQQHVAQRPFTCTFCSKCYKRSDVLRAHQFQCKERGSAPLPEGRPKGRKRSSCLSCVKLRTKCDQETPCTRCQERGEECIRSASSPQRAQAAARPKSRDAIPIHHLLNAPDGDDLVPRFPIRDTPSRAGRDEDDAANGTEDSSGASHWSEDYGNPRDVFVGAILADLDCVNFDSFFGGFDSSTFSSYPPNANMPHVTSGTGFGSPSARALEPRAFEIRQLLLGVTTKFAIEYPDSPQLEHLETNIGLLTHVEIDHCLTLFFQNFYRHCPIIHRPSFRPAFAPIPLVLGCVALGAMYSEQAKVCWMKNLLDVIESYIFSLPEVRDEFFGTLGVSEAPDEDAVEYHFQLFQGAYLFVVVQYFSGNLAGQRRARRQRFPSILNV